MLWLGEGHSVVPFHSYLGYEPDGAWGNNTYIQNLNTKVTKLHLHMKSGGRIYGQMSSQSPVVWWYREVNCEVIEGRVGFSHMTNTLQTSVAMQRPVEHISMVTLGTTIEELMETVFSVWSFPKEGMTQRVAV
jgi:hypothetical protein